MIRKESSFTGKHIDKSKSTLSPMQYSGGKRDGSPPPVDKNTPMRRQQSQESEGFTKFAKQREQDFFQKRQQDI